MNKHYHNLFEDSHVFHQMVLPTITFHQDTRLQQDKSPQHLHVRHAAEWSEQQYCTTGSLGYNCQPVMHTKWRQFSSAMALKPGAMTILSETFPSSGTPFGLYRCIRMKNDHVLKWPLLSSVDCNRLHVSILIERFEHMMYVYTRTSHYKPHFLPTFPQPSTHVGVDQRLKYVTQAQQQRPRSPTVTHLACV